MPVKDGGKYLSLAIRSTLRAMPRDSELVIANDGSTDNTQEIIEQFRDKRVRSIVFSASRGVSASLNALIAVIDSERVARMDADDVCLPYRFGYQEAIIGANDCVFSNVIFINDIGVPRRSDLPGRIGSRAVPIHLLMGNSLVHPTMYARRSFFDSLGGYAATPAEDYDLWLRAAKADLRLMRSAVPTLLYRKHPLQVSVNGGWLESSWDSRLDPSYIALAEKLLDIRIPDNSIRLSVSSGNQGALLPEVRDRFTQSLARAISQLPPPDQILAQLRLRRLARAAPSDNLKDRNAE